MLKVKICGLTSYEDAKEAIVNGSDYIGFIFAPSKRRISPALARDIITRLKTEGLLDSVETVGVFVNELPGIINKVAEESGIDIVQIHGDEDPAIAYELALPWYRALRASSVDDYEAMHEWSCSRFLVDARVEGVYGGSGVTVPVDLARAGCEAAHELGREFFLAGGITPENAAAIIGAVEPDGIDVSSGVETSPGVKDHQLIKKLFAAVRSAGEE